MHKLSYLAMAITSTTINPIIFSNIYQKAEKINGEKVLNYQSIDWNDVKHNLDNMFKNISYEKNKNELGAANEKEFNKIIQFVKQNNDKNIITFKNKNLNLSQLNFYISNQNENFASIYKNPNKYFKKIDSNVEWKSNNVSFCNSHELNELKNYVFNLRIYKTTFATLSATAAVAAAGFWAAAWWFGISIPWAIGATLASTLTGTAASGITIALAKYDQEMNKLIKAGSVFGAVFSLGHIFYKILYPIFVGLSASATAVSWAFPAVLAVVGISVAVISWISLYK